MFASFQPILAQLEEHETKLIWKSMIQIFSRVLLERLFGERGENQIFNKDL
jgi:hypothetical protein